MLRPFATALIVLLLLAVLVGSYVLTRDEAAWRDAQERWQAFQDNGFRAPRADQEGSSDAATEDGVGTAEEEGADWRSSLSLGAIDEREFADRLLEENEVASELLLEASLKDLDAAGLQARFIELMARDLDDRRSVEYAGRVLREIAKLDPQMGVALLYEMTPAEREQLVPSLARGWVASDPAAAFRWIETAWIDVEGSFIDRDLQNRLFVNAMDAFLSEDGDYAFAASVLHGVVDPELRETLVQQVAERMVMDGPETAFARLAELENSILDQSVLDAVADQWAARDSVGAMEWALGNEMDVSSKAARSIAKQLVLNGQTDSLLTFFAGLEDLEKRDSVAAEAARLSARRDLERSANWALAIEDPLDRRLAVQDGLRELGFESVQRTVAYVEAVYGEQGADRESLVFESLVSWLEVDEDAVVDFLGSGRANLSQASSEVLLERIGLAR
ncbi:hypothetical protein [Pelagicoccus sp. SDUM812003]|uniref:hypothetical protein n=1 Tax=Pelagicoccus sp. SDUM812003 TaxID=3041267 RepID=UPI00280E654E|nr:hypothetical protein [Pelagicoccus sp. SDUM812003]MDQ8202244.1 hypothetical protein [Pelagicoccus sp. SDUM812003]